MSDLDESQQRFLDEHLLPWRNKISAALGHHAETIEELEAHLRDAFGELIGAGRSPDEAWQLAVERLGSTEQLAAEYEKLPAERLGWLTSAKLVFLLQAVLVVWLAVCLVRDFALVRGDWLLTAHVFAVTIGYTSLIAIGIVTFWSLTVRAVWGWATSDAQRLARSLRPWTAGSAALTVLGILLGIWWSRDHLGRFWGWDAKEIAGAVLAIWTVAVAIRLFWDRRLGALPTLLLGQGGALVVMLCWFGPVYFPRGLHAYGFPSLGPVAAALSLGVLLVVAMSLCPPGRIGRLLRIAER